MTEIGVPIYTCKHCGETTQRLPHRCRVAMADMLVNESEERARAARKAPVGSAAVAAARSAFELYAARSPGFGEPMNLGWESCLVQAGIAQWHAHEYGAVTMALQVLATCEEVGELARCVVKREQRIRGMEDEAAFREAAAKELADVVISLYQVATMLRVDLGALVAGRFGEIRAERDRKKRPIGGAE